MEKFETLKAGLGNGLIVTDENLNGVKRRFKLSGIDFDSKEWIYAYDHKKFKGISFPLEECKPHLFNLSDLNKPIRVEGYNDGKEFVPAKELFKGMDNLILTTFEHKVFNLWATYTILDEVFTDPIIGVGGIKDADYWIVKKLQCWHFNTEGLDESDYIDASKSKVYEPKDTKFHAC